jgi:hypothetical protein
VIEQARDLYQFASLLDRLRYLLEIQTHSNVTDFLTMLKFTMMALQVFLLAIPRFAISVFLASPSNIQALTHTIHFRNVLLDPFLMLTPAADMAKSEIGSWPRTESVRH